MAQRALLEELKQKVQDLPDEQVRLIEQFAEILRTSKRKEEVAVRLKELLQKRVRTMSSLSDAEAQRLAIEAVAWARSQL